MFTRADRLLAEAPPDLFRYHVIGFHWEGFHPLLMAFDNIGGVLTTMDMEETDLIISEAKRCVGYYDHDGYHRCPFHSRVTSFPQCRNCASTWIPIQECIYEPQCRGEKCGCRLCAAEHTVYIAFLGKMTKIGMTQSRRLKERGIEQGADAIAPLAVCENRMDARGIENLLSKGLGVPQRVPATSAVKELLNAQSEEAIRRRLEELRRRAVNLIDLTDEDLILLDDYPLPSLNGTLMPVSTPGAHMGHTVGVKGKFLIYRDGPLKAINLSDTVARFASSR